MPPEDYARFLAKQAREYLYQKAEEFMQMRTEDQIFSGNTIPDINRKWVIIIPHEKYSHLVDADNIYAILNSMADVRVSVKYLIEFKNVDSVDIRVDNFGK